MAARFDLLTLELFVAVVEQQSIARAAEREHIAASAVSRRISDLETMLGVEVFKRHAKGIELTAAGEALLRHARALRSLVIQMERELRDYQSGLRGTVRLAVNKSAILQTLPQDLTEFLNRNPLVRIDLEESISPTIIRSVVDGHADIGIYGGNIPAPGLKTLLYRKDELVVVLPRNHSLAGHQTLRFAQLIESEFVCLERGSSIETLCQQAAAELGHTMKLRVRVGSFEAQLRMIATGMGIGIVPRPVVARTAPDAGLCWVTFAESWAWRPLNIRVSVRTELPVAARLLIEHLVRVPDTAPPSVAVSRETFLEAATVR